MKAYKPTSSACGNRRCHDSHDAPATQDRLEGGPQSPGVDTTSRYATTRPPAAASYCAWDTASQARVPPTTNTCADTRRLGQPWRNDTCPSACELESAHRVQHDQPRSQSTRRVHQQAVKKPYGPHMPNRCRPNVRCSNSRTRLFNWTVRASNDSNRSASVDCRVSIPIHSLPTIGEIRGLRRGEPSRMDSV